MKIDISLEKNIEYLEKQFKDCSDIIHKKRWIAGNKYPIYMVYMDSMVARELVEGEILKALMYSLKEIPESGALDYVWKNGLHSADIDFVDNMEEAITHGLSGDTVIFGENSAKAIIINSKQYPSRGVQAAESEVTLRGSKESFSESFRINTVLIRRRIRDTRLKIYSAQLGRRTKTDIGLMYMDDLVRPEVLKEVKDKIAQLDIDGVLDSGSLEQLIEGEYYSPFPQFQSTERPDKVASALMEGRVAIVVDNSPMVLLLPTTLNCFYQASDDYYNRFGAVCFTRILRYLASLLAIILPAGYVAIANFHPEILPTNLALSFVAARQGVPFPLAIEVIIMEIAFELLREAGIRLPGPMGSTLGIVGGLIVGQAAVEANIVSPIVVIVVALTALSTFTIPNEGFSSAFRLVKFYILILSAFLGILGFVFGILSVFIHLASLKSFNIPYLMPFVASNVNNREDAKDSMIRFPLPSLKNRPIFTKQGARTRMRNKK